MNPAEAESHSPVVGPTKPRLLSVLGPGLITGASDTEQLQGDMVELVSELARFSPPATLVDK